MSKKKANVIMRVHQPSEPFPYDRLPKKLISGVIDPSEKRQTKRSNSESRK